MTRHLVPRPDGVNVARGIMFACIPGLLAWGLIIGVPVLIVWLVTR